MVLRPRPSLSLLPDLALCPLPLLLALGGWRGGLLAAPLAPGESRINCGSERVLEVLSPSLPRSDTSSSVGTVSPGLRAPAAVFSVPVVS